MKILRKKWQIVVAVIMAAPFLLGAKSDPINYDGLDLEIKLDALRAGNHDVSGENQYYFVTTIYGLPVIKEEIKKPFDTRLKLEKKQGEFAQIVIKNLKWWQLDKKPNPANSFPLKGDTIREIVAETMRGFNVAEDQVTILCRIEMFERNKKLMFFGEDLKVGGTEFKIIPESLPHGPLVQNAELSITDALGSQVTLSVHYKALDLPKNP